MLATLLMTERIAELVLDESKWLSMTMLLSLIAVVVAVARRRRQGSSRHLELLWAMNLFYGCVIGTMASGHLLAVTIKLSRGTLEGSMSLLYPLGLGLAVPAWWLAFAATRLPESEQPAKRRMLGLNIWLGALLLALGLHNWPLAAPAALNIGYQLQSSRTVGWTIGTVTIVAYLALFVGSLVFLASGQSFEQLRQLP